MALGQRSRLRSLRVLCGASPVNGTKTEHGEAKKSFLCPLQASFLSGIRRSTHSGA